MITIFYQHDVSATSISVNLFDSGTLVDTVTMTAVSGDAVNLWIGTLADPEKPTLAFQVFADAETAPSAFGVQEGLVDNTTLSLGFTPTLSVPSAEENATAVRSELTTELDRIDANISDTAKTTDVTSAKESIEGAIGGLNDFNPASDTVAHVTLVDTCTTNTDMRGTNNAVTSLSGIATEANATANAMALAGLISDLNDLDSGDVQVAAASALTAYDPPTRAEATSDKDSLIEVIGTPLQVDDYDPAPSAEANASAVWAAGNRTLTSFGTLVADIVEAVWAYSGATTLLSNVSAIFSKLPSSSYLAGSPNSNGSINVSVTEDVRVASFTPAAKQQLAGTTIRNETPAWTVDGFDQPLISGDAYLDERAWVLVVEGYTGPALTEADSIQLDGVRGEEDFSFPFVAEKLDDHTYTLASALDSSETDISKGMWETHLYALFGDTDADRVTLLGPKAKLKVIGR